MRIVRVSNTWMYAVNPGAFFGLDQSWHCGNVLSKILAFVGSIFNGCYVTLELDPGRKSTTTLYNKQTFWMSKGNFEGIKKKINLGNSPITQKKSTAEKIMETIGFYHLKCTSDQ